MQLCVTVPVRRAVHREVHDHSIVHQPSSEELLHKCNIHAATWAQHATCKMQRLMPYNMHLLQKLVCRAAAKDATPPSPTADRCTMPRRCAAASMCTHVHMPCCTMQHCTAVQSVLRCALRAAQCAVRWGWVGWGWVGYGVVRCDAVRYGAVRCCAMQCRTTAQHGTARHGTARHGTARHTPHHIAQQRQRQRQCQRQHERWQGWEYDGKGADSPASRHQSGRTITQA